MSEYQYYEFLALDRPLTAEEIKEVRAISSRAEITPTHFVNTYNYGDFRGNPKEFLTRYYDAMVYVANWGSRRFMLRLPRGLMDEKVLGMYCAGESADAYLTAEAVVLDLSGDTEDPDDWEQGEGWMGSLVPLRADLLQGDHRALYLAWLRCADNGDLDEDNVEPPVPPGLRQLSGALSALADFLRLDPRLIEAAAEASSDLSPRPEGFSAWLTGLSTEEKDRLLLAFVEGTDPHLGSRLLQRFQKTAGSAGAGPGAKRRTVRALLAVAEAKKQAYRREQERKAAEEKARREAAEAAVRAKHLAALAKRQEQAWADAERLIDTKQPKAYDEAVTFLKDLRDIAAEEKKLGLFTNRLAALQERHSKKLSFLERLRKAGLS